MNFNSKLFLTISAVISTMFAVFNFKFAIIQFLMITPGIYFFGVQNVCTEEVCAEKCLLNLEFNLYLKLIYNILLQQSFIFLAGLVSKKKLMFSYVHTN